MVYWHCNSIDFSEVKPEESLTAFSEEHDHIKSKDLQLGTSLFFMIIKF